MFSRTFSIVAPYGCICVKQLPTVYEASVFLVTFLLVWLLVGRSSRPNVACSKFGGRAGAPGLHVSRLWRWPLHVSVLLTVWNLPPYTVAYTALFGVVFSEMGGFFLTTVSHDETAHGTCTFCHHRFKVMFMDSHDCQGHKTWNMQVPEQPYR